MTMSQSVCPTKRDLSLAISLLKQHGLAAVDEAAFVGGGPETERLAEGAESVARVVAWLRTKREETPDD